MADKFAWKRKIRITLTSKLNPNQQMIIGTETDNLNIDIQGSKYLAPNKDSGVIAISNLGTEKILEITLLEYFKIKIEYGYESFGSTYETLFEGEVTYISQKLNSHRDTIAYITYGSEVIASLTQSRINFSINSSINYYTALQYLMTQAGINPTGAKISPYFKNKLTKKMRSGYDNFTNAIDALVNGDQELSAIISSSDFTSSVLSVTTLDDKRRVQVNLSSINISDHPTISSDGLHLKVVPTFNFAIGDIIDIGEEGNGLINGTVANGNYETLASTNALKFNYIDKNGQYMIRQIDYHFQNRGPEFSFNIKAWSLELVKNYYYGGS